MKLYFEDHVIPYMTDKRHASDTLFLVMEEDFRMYKIERGESSQVRTKEGPTFLIVDDPEASRLEELEDLYKTRVGETLCKRAARHLLHLQ